MNYDDILLILNIILCSLSGIIIICNIYGLYNMFKIIPKMKFEKYVLMSGIVECSLTVLYSRLRNEIIANVVQILQIAITLYINKRFLRLFFELKRNKKIKNLITKAKEKFHCKKNDSIVNKSDGDKELNRNIITENKSNYRNVATDSFGNSDEFSNENKKDKQEKLIQDSPKTEIDNTNKIIKINEKDDFYIVDEKDFEDYDVPNENKEGTHLYSIVFWVLVVLNIIVFFVCVIGEWGDYETLSEYQLLIQLGHSFFCVIMSIILFYFALKIRTLMIEEMFEEYKEIQRAATNFLDEKHLEKMEESLENNREVLEGELNSNNLFLKTRNKQLMLIAISNLVTDLIELIAFSFITFKYYKDNFTKEVLYKVVEYSFLIGAGANFMAFFYVVRKTFTIEYNKNNYNNNSDNKVNNDFGSSLIDDDSLFNNIPNNELNGDSYNKMLGNENKKENNNEKNMNEHEKKNEERNKDIEDFIN